MPTLCLLAGREVEGARDCFVYTCTDAGGGSNFTWIGPAT
jgi:hypothetical protein